MEVTQINVVTGDVTERNYTQKERDGRGVMKIESTNRRVIRNKEQDIKTKREAAIEEILKAGTSAKAKAYQDAIK